jgi:hypothetical protein
MLRAQMLESHNYSECHQSAAVAGLDVTGRIISFALPFAVLYFYILNHFYDRGALFLDSGWFADLMWHKPIWLPNPDVLHVDTNFPPTSFYAIHFSPIFSLISLASYVLPLDRAQIFAAYSGMAHGLLGFFAYRICLRWLFPLSSIAFVISTFIGVGVALNGLSISIASYPHYEVMIAALLVGTLYFLLDHRLSYAASTAAFAFLIREDAGFQLSGLLFLLIVLNCWRGISVSAQRHLIYFCMGGLFASALAIIGKSIASPSFSSFAWVYGNPPLAHVTSNLLIQRATYILHSRVCVWLPLLLLVIGAFALRAPSLLVGAFAFLPWLILQIVAIGNIPGTLQAHYAYPVLISLAWAPLSAAIDIPIGPTQRILRLGLTVIMLGSTFIANPAVFGFLSGSIPSRTALHPAPTERFMRLLAESVPLVNKVRADSSVISLDPEIFTKEAWLRPNDWTEQLPEGDIDLIVFFRQGFEREKALAQIRAMRNPVLYSVPGTQIMVVTNGNVDPSLAISAQLFRDKM